LAKLDRRSFLYGAALAGAAGLAFHRLTMREELGSVLPGSAKSYVAEGFGALQPAVARNTGERLLALPAGFEYTVIGKAGAKMSDGRLTPPRHDGMAAFHTNGQLRLIRNHEVSNPTGDPDIAMGVRPYDRLAGGGTTTLIINPETRELVQDFVSLSGTLVNCAGGPTPWGTWISCEETVLGQPKFSDVDGKQFGGFTASHGYCFEVAASADGEVVPVPIKEMGRFVHEAVAVDPVTNIVYETEDRMTAGFYRYIPNSPGKLAAGGRLQMLAIKDRPNYDTRTGQKVGVALGAKWVDIKDPDPTSTGPESDQRAVYGQGIAQGAATFARLEGCWHGDGRIFFTSTNGGEQRLGQVWEYRPAGHEEGLLTMLFESPSADVLQSPDNLCVTPRGGLLICEDGDGEQYVRGLTRDGRIFDFAKNMVPGYEDKEFAGATFSPDGKTLFFNIQVPGLTFAIWGPWEKALL
jgi:secreted PhoX family phosphatase